jgi:hypothetical protein
MYDYPCDTLLLLGQKAILLQIVVLISPLIILCFFRNVGIIHLKMPEVVTFSKNSHNVRVTGGLKFVTSPFHRRVIGNKSGKAHVNRIQILLLLLLNYYIVFSEFVFIFH